MKFGPVALDAAVGAILAHAVRQGGTVLKKGTVLDGATIEMLRGAGLAEVVVARLEPGDIGEDAAALALAGALAGAQVRVEAPFTGRSNLYAETDGVLIVVAGAIDAVNGIDEAITVSTLARFKPVVAGEMVATVKIIPFAVPDALIARARQAASAGAIRIAPFRAKRVAVVSTVLPGLKPSVIDKTLKVLAQRLAIAGARIVADLRVPHEADALAAALRGSEAGQADIVIVFGASAITDRADVIPSGVTQAGGLVEHFGMPVDPGNLLMIGRIGPQPVLGAPGCARSPRENGFDWVLQRLLADVPVTRADIQGLGVGGLLMEIVSRPQPRAADAPVPRPAARTDVVVLAAGKSTRMGANKLLALHEGKPLVRHAAEHALAAGAGPVTVVTGHQGEAVEAALAGLDLRIVPNPKFADGMATSLAAGIASLPADSAGAVIVLGDMPRVAPTIIRRLADAFAEGTDVKAVVPVRHGVRGNPVFLARALFAAIGALRGDAGARRLIEAAGADVTEILVDDPGIHLDVDTPEALARLAAGDQ